MQRVLHAKSLPYTLLQHKFFFNRCSTLSQARAEQSIAHLVDSASYNNQQSLPSLPHLYATRAHPQFAIFFLTHCTRSLFQVVWIQKCCRSCLLAISLIAGSLFRVDWIWHLATAWHVAVYEYFFARMTSSDKWQKRLLKKWKRLNHVIRKQGVSFWGVGGLNRLSPTDCSGVELAYHQPEL